ncbi:peritrophin-44 isoform X2 [Drosophila guanche]|uniref:Blast:Peritrophin-44 n=1 Tax=Drosophila guanche TaxID=7266 RepID=A0A3B0KHX4_DROGU|nr:peritrophin-44 isoform X2 [Drosophila guanche]SPP84711.1 blast:Peritrophin-44 [Drosophila guanche]
MKGFNMKVCALAACLLLVGHVSGYSMEDLCAQWSGSGYVGDPADCHGWGYCQGQKLVSWNKCPNGRVFNAPTSTCGFANSTICTTSAVATCTAAKSPMYVAVPSDCNQYGYCFGNGSIGYGNCGAGGVYAANNNTCVWGPTCPQDTICRFMKNDIFVGDPNNCGSYLQCNNGYGTPGQCGTGKFYNPGNGMCQGTNPCTGESGNSGSNPGTTYTVGQSVAAVCTGGTAIAPATTFFMPDKQTCYGYFYCTTAAGNGVWNACLTGTHFDPDTQKCVSPASVDCTYNRCGNVNSPFMAVSGQNCKQYEICSSGATAYCPSSNPFYDEVHNICTKDKPAYTICGAE